MSAVTTKVKLAFLYREFFRENIIFEFQIITFFSEMNEREKKEKAVEDQWSSRAKKKVEYHQGIL